MGEWTNYKINFKRYIYLENDWSNKTLNLRRHEFRLLSLLNGERSLNNVLPHVVFLGKVEQLADLGGPLRSQTLRHGDISQAGDFLINKRCYRNLI